MTLTDKSSGIRSAVRALAPAVTAVAAIALLLSAASCSVKEDRDVCPTYLTVKSNGHVGTPGFDGKITYNISTQEVRKYERVTEGSKPFFGDGRVFKVPRKEYVNVDVFSRVQKMQMRDSLLYIPLGSDCDEFLGGSSVVNAPSDLSETTVTLDRHSAKITMGLIGEVYYPYPYYFRITGNIDGFELPGLQPHWGRFAYRMDLLDGDVFECTVPRQVDNSLTLEIREKDGDAVVSEIALGHVIAEMDYDWTAQDLTDILIGVDFARLSMYITVNDWTRVIIVQIVI